jgi:hypothetical protein
MTEDLNMMQPMRALLVVLALLAAGVSQGQTPDAYQRGELVRIKDVKKPAVLKVVGLPNELVEANETGVYIEDVAVTGYSREFLTRNRLPRQYIPIDHYFVMGEERAGQDISEHLGIHPSDSIEPAK